jgi:hypothetical protein
MAKEGFKRKLTAILSTEVEGYSVASLAMTKRPLCVR